jgi:hypothetical protein
MAKDAKEKSDKKAKKEKEKGDTSVGDVAIEVDVEMVDTDGMEKVCRSRAFRPA